MILNHSQLCDRAVKWLVNMGCSIAVKEITCWATYERPDAIGFIDGLCVTVEVKTSRSDFLRDAHKPHRKDGAGMGQFRYFMAEKGLIKPEEVPTGWGLVEVCGKVCRITTGPKKFEYRNMTFSDSNVRAEKGLLASLVRRLRDGELSAQKIMTRKTVNEVQGINPDKKEENENAC